MTMLALALGALLCMQALAIDASSLSETSDVSFFSSSSFSESEFFDENSFSSDSRAICSKALDDVEAKPKGPAFAYFTGFRDRILRQKKLWLNPLTRREAADSFSAEFKVRVTILNALGRVIYPPDPRFPFVFAPIVYKTWSLNTPSMKQSYSGRSYYVFNMFDDETGEYLMIGLFQFTSLLPKNQLCFRKVGLNRLN